MRVGSNRDRAVMIAALSGLLAGCAPNYKVPDDSPFVANLQFKYTSSMQLLHTGRFAYSPSPVKCSLGAQEGEQQLAIISKGNPLISDLNANGLPIAAGKPFRLKAEGIPIRPEDGCFKIMTFVPRAGATYEASFDQSGAGRCSLAVAELTGTKSERLVVQTAMEEACVR